MWTVNRGVAREGRAGRARAPPEFGRSVNPIRTRVGRFRSSHYCQPPPPPPGFKKLSTPLVNDVTAKDSKGSLQLLGISHIWKYLANFNLQLLRVFTLYRCNALTEAVTSLTCRRVRLAKCSALLIFSGKK